MWKFLFSLCIAIAHNAAMAIEEPSYEVVQQLEGAEHLGKLEAILRAAQLQWAGEPTLSRYNPPFTPWFMRRNEIWLALKAPAPA